MSRGSRGTTAASRVLFSFSVATAVAIISRCDNDDEQHDGDEGGRPAHETASPRPRVRPHLLPTTTTSLTTIGCCSTSGETLGAAFERSGWRWPG